MGADARPLRAAAFRAVILVALAIAVSGCSRLSLVYGFAGPALSREAAYHLNLDETEQAVVDDRVAAFLDWHSAVMLPRYARFLSDQADIVERGPPDRATVADTVTKLRTLLDDLVAGAAPYTADVLVNHTAPGKVRYLKARMDERLAERLEEAAEDPPEERLEDRVERTADNFERLTGDLNDGQKEIIRRYVKATLADNAIWLKNRANRQRAFTEFLSRRPGEAEIGAFVQRILLRPHEIVDPDYLAVSERRWTRFETLLFEIMVSLTDEQRETLVETLRGYAAEMLDLST